MCSQPRSQPQGLIWVIRSLFMFKWIRARSKQSIKPLVGCKRKQVFETFHEPSSLQGNYWSEANPLHVILDFPWQ